MAAANALAKTPGVLKPAVAGTATAAGSAIRDLGKGSEGLATLVAHPEHGVAVRKLYDPKGISGRELIQRKVQAGTGIGQNNKYVAGYKGQATAPHGAPMHFSEYVSPKGPIAPPVAGSSAEADAIRKSTIRTHQANIRAGFSGGAQDVRKANMQWDGNTGTFKTVDYVPAHRGEFEKVLRHRSYDPATGIGTYGSKLYNPNTGVSVPISDRIHRALGDAPERVMQLTPESSGSALWNKHTPDLIGGKQTSAARLKQYQFGGVQKAREGIARDARRMSSGSIATAATGLAPKVTDTASTVLFKRGKPLPIAQPATRPMNMAPTPQAA